MNWYSLRLTLPDTNACDTIDMLIRNIGLGTHIVTGHEYSRDKVEHTHSVIGTPLQHDSLRKSIKKMLNTSKRADSNGNTIYSLKKVTDLNGAVRYAIKCGDYRVSIQFPTEPLIWARENPWIFQFDEVYFKKQLKKLDDNYVNTKQTDYDYVDALLTCYAKHQQSFNLHQLKMRWLRFANIRNNVYCSPIDTATTPHTVREHLIWNILRI